MDSTYVLNDARKVAHRVFKEGSGTFSKERCNLDQILKRREAAYVPPGYRRCLWCKP